MAGMETGSDPGNEEVIAVTSTGMGLESRVDPRFGRCAYFAISGPSGALTAVVNTARDFGNGAGIEAAKQVIDAKVDVVITGNIGPNAFRVLSAAGVRVFVGGCGTVQDSLEWYRTGAMKEAYGSTGAAHRGKCGNRWGQRE